MASSDLLSFGRCSCGAWPRAPSLDRQPWASIAGFDRSVCIRRRDGALMSDTPRPGDAMHAELRFPFAGRAGRPVWTTFDPALAELNGYDEHPDDLRGFRLIRLRVDGPAASDPASGVLQATGTVLAVVDPLALLDLPPRQGTIDGGLTGLAHATASASCGPLRRVAWDFEGDLGRWLLLFCHDRGVTLLAHGIWGAHEDEVVAGHRPLSRSERDLLDSADERPGS